MYSFYFLLSEHNLVVSKELEELIEMYRMEANLQREDSDVSLGSENGLKVNHLETPHPTLTK